MLIDLSIQELFDVWCDLTGPQKKALGVLADGRAYYCWKRSTDQQARAGKGAVNATVAHALTKLKLARTLDYGGPFTGATIEITDIGQAVWDASVFGGAGYGQSRGDAE